METVDFVLAAVLLAVAVLYSTVGHGGASGYLAVMALAGLAPEVMKPTALSLNILVAGIGTVRFARAGGFNWRMFWPFVVTSIPCAFLGGTWQLDPSVYKRVLGVVLLLAAVRLIIPQRSDGRDQIRPVSVPPALICGAVIGLVSGLVGVGGGIFLSPLLLLMHWAAVRQTAGVSAAFILVNSVSGLLGHIGGGHDLHTALPLWAAAVVIGGFIGSSLGIRWLGAVAFRRALAVVLVIASVKMFLPSGGDSDGAADDGQTVGAVVGHNPEEDVGPNRLSNREVVTIHTVSATLGPVPSSLTRVRFVP